MDDQPNEDDLLAEAWGVIANVSGGRWDEQDPEWVAAAERWRDRWFATMPNTDPVLVDALVDLVGKYGKRGVLLALEATDD